jgi:hypothetical protein
MTTKNIRIVGYLPPALHQQLREYMTIHSLTESAALVQIVICLQPITNNE